MNKNLLKTVLRNKEMMIPLIFTQKQFSILEKYDKDISLSNSEKKALYTSIKKKMEALYVLKKEQESKEYYINGCKDIIPGRLNEAKKILNQYSKKYDKIFVGGSFLFSGIFNDIDVFILREKGYKEEWKDSIHIVYLTEKKLSNPVFKSATLISVSNFIIPSKLIKKRSKLSELMSTYHEAVIELLRKEKKREMIRHLIFDFNLHCRNEIVNPKKLQELVNTATLENLANYTKELLLNLFSKKYLYVGIQWYIQTLEDTIKSTKNNDNLIEYKKTYEELLYGKQRNKEAIV